MSISVQHGPAPHLVGRADDLVTVRRFLREGALGGGLLLTGEAGVGKTALLDTVAEVALLRGTVVLRAAGAEFESDLGYSTLHQLLLPLSAVISHLDPRYRDALGVALGVGPARGTDRELLEEATLRLFRSAGEGSTVLVIVDDLHWVDRASAAVLSALARTIAGTQVGLLAATRPGPEGFFEPGPVTRHQVLPLSPPAASELLASRFPGLSAPATARVLDEAQGNPLALLELPAALDEAEQTGTRPLPPRLPLGRRLPAVFTGRIDSLPPRTFALLLAAALEGVRAPTVLQGADDDVGPAVALRLVTRDPVTGSLTFQHPLIQSSVVQHATGEQRRRAHEVLARAMGADPDRRARHLAAAAITPDERVAGLLEEASRRMLGRGDALGAVAALLRAADLSPLEPDRRRRISQAAYVGAETTGDLRTAARLLDDSSDGPPRAAPSLQTAAAAAYALLSGPGEVDSAYRLLIGALGSSNHARDPDPLLASALQALLYVCLGGERPELWDGFHTALRQFSHHGSATLDLQIQLLADPVRTAHARLAELDSAVGQLADETDPAQIERVARMGAGLDRVPACSDALWRVVRNGRDGGAVATSIGALTLLALAAVKEGRWEEASRLADEGLASSSRHGYDLISWRLHFTHAHVAAARGEYAVAQAVTDRMTRWAAPRGMQSVLMLCWDAQGTAALSSGRFEDAYQLFARVSPAGEFASHIAAALGVPMSLVEAAMAAGRTAEAAAHVEAMHRLKVASLSPRLALLVAGSAAMAAPRLDRHLFHTALMQPGSARWPFELGRIHLAYGQRLRRARATTEARIQLTHALTLFERLGAVPWSARAQSELSATSPTRSPTGSASRTLTPQEHRIASLAASGLTNKQIAERLLLSHRTVGSHLQQTFLKLGIGTRAGLRDALEALSAPT